MFNHTFTVTRGDIMDLADIASLVGISPAAMRTVHRSPERYPGYSWLPEPIGRIGTAPVWDRATVEAAREARCGPQPGR